MLLLRLFAAVCAAEKTLEKKLDCAGAGPFSGVGVRGAAVMLESLLGPSADVGLDFTRRCDIILPEGETTTFRSRLRALAPAIESMESSIVGVGGVFTMTGVLSSEGGVRGGAAVLMAFMEGERVRRSGEGFGLLLID